MKSDFYTAIAQIAAERGIPEEAVMSSVEHALKTVYRKEAGVSGRKRTSKCASTRRPAARESSSTGIVAEEIVDPSRADQPGRGARQRSNIKIGNSPRQRADAEGLRAHRRPDSQAGRPPEIRDFEREMVYNEYADRVGEVLNGIMQRADARRSWSNWARPRRSCRSARRCRTSAIGPASD